MTREVKVGIFVIAVIALIMIMSAALEDVSIFGRRGYNITFYMSDAGGLVKNSLVKYHGIEVGKVTRIELNGGRVAVNARITSDTLIPDNVSIMLAQDGLLGERYIDLRVRGDIPAMGFLTDGGVYDNFKATMTIEDLTENVQAIAEQIRSITGALNDTLGSDTGRDHMQATLENLRYSTESLRTLLEGNQQQINNIIANLEHMSRVFENITTSRQYELDEMVANFHAVSDSLRNFTANLDNILDKDQDELHETILNLREFSENAKYSFNNINDLTDNLNAGSGTVGMLLTDNETRDQLKDAIGSLSGMLGRTEKIIFELEAGLEYLPSPDDYHGTFSMKIIPSDKRFYYLGISNKPAGRTKETTTEYYVWDHNDPSNNQHYTEKKKKEETDTIAFSLQYGLIFNDYIVGRGGIFENRLGFGVDLYPLYDYVGPDFVMSFEASDFYRDDYGTYYKFNSKYYFLDHFFVQAGWDDFGSSRSSFSFGAGVNIIDEDIKYVIGSLPLSAATQ